MPRAARHAREPSGGPRSEQRGRLFWGRESATPTAVKPWDEPLRRRSKARNGEPSTSLPFARLQYQPLGPRREAAPIACAPNENDVGFIAPALPRKTRPAAPAVPMGASRPPDSWPAPDGAARRARSAFGGQRAPAGPVDRLEPRPAAFRKTAHPDRDVAGFVFNPPHDNARPGQNPPQTDFRQAAQASAAIASERYRSCTGGTADGVSSSPTFIKSPVPSCPYELLPKQRSSTGSACTRAHV